MPVPRDAGLKPGATLKAKRKSRFLVAMLLGMTTKTNERESPRAAQARRAPWATKAGPTLQKGWGTRLPTVWGIGHIARMLFVGNYLWANSGVYQAIDGRSSYP